MAGREELTKALADAYKVATGKDLDIVVLKGLMDPAVRPQLKRAISEYDFDGQRADTFGGP